MGTSAPAIIEHDIPMTTPYVPPKQLPAPNPSRFAPDYTSVPERVAVPVPIKRGDHYGNTQL
jgi:hypothetical protein